MELAEIIGLRPALCAGLLLTLTRRCPLSCAHCSTSSTMAGEEPEGADLLRFVGSFTDDDRPEVMLLTGGEPLLRPRLAAELAVTARRRRTRSAVLTGAFFARDGRMPRRIRQAVAAVDHFSVSMDAFHEREVPREHVFAVLRQVLDAGVPASVHAVGSGPDDPYLAGLVAEVRRVFADAVPLLVNTVRAVGRAASWSTARPPSPDPRVPRPCTMAAWPTVAFDGVVVACCNQQTVDRRPVPDHLRLGHIGTDRWADIRARSLGSPTLRMVRVAGPTYLRARFSTAAGSATAESADGDAEPGYCDSCRLLGTDPATTEGIAQTAAGAAGAFLDRYGSERQVAAGPVALMRRHGSVRHADLVDLAALPKPPPADASRPRPSAATALRTKLALVEPTLRAATAALWQSPDLGRRYPAYLSAMHGVIRASVPLMEHAAERSAGLGADDLLASRLLAYFRTHIEQERGHDAWLLADLAALGRDAEDILREPPAPVVARLVGAQYYWIGHFHPVALLGYLAVMEGNSPTEQLAGWIRTVTGAPEAALRTVRDHAALDTGHTAEIYRLLDALDLSSAQAQAVSLSALHTAATLKMLFTDLVKRKADHAERI